MLNLDPDFNYDPELNSIEDLNMITLLLKEPVSQPSNLIFNSHRLFLNAQPSALNS